MSNQFSDYILTEFLCPITKTIMRNPVIAADKQTYEREAIENWFNQENNTSPLTGVPLRHKILIENEVLKNIIKHYGPEILRKKNKNKIDNYYAWSKKKCEEEYELLKQKSEKEALNLNNQISDLRTELNQKDRDYEFLKQKSEKEALKLNNQISDLRTNENVRLYMESIKDHKTYNSKETYILETDIERFFRLPWNEKFKNDLKTWLKCDDEIYTRIITKSIEIVKDKRKLEEINQNIKNINYQLIDGFQGIDFEGIDFGRIVGTKSTIDWIDYLVDYQYLMIEFDYLDFGKISDDDINYLKPLKLRYVCRCHNKCLQNIFVDTYDVGIFILTK